MEIRRGLTPLLSRGLFEPFFWFSVTRPRVGATGFEPVRLETANSLESVHSIHFTHVKSRPRRVDTPFRRPSPPLWREQNGTKWHGRSSPSYPVGVHGADLTATRQANHGFSQFLRKKLPNVHGVSDRAEPLDHSR